MKRHIVNILALFYLMLIRVRFSSVLSDIRIQCLRIRGAKVGNNVTIRPFCTFSGCKGITIGDGVYIGEYGVFSATDSQISVAPGTLIGPRVFVVSRSHIIGGNVSQSGYHCGRVAVGANCWIAANVSILAGVSIGDNSVVGAGSLVNASVPPSVVAFGVPCRISRKIERIR